MNDEGIALKYIKLMSALRAQLTALLRYSWEEGLYSRADITWVLICECHKLRVASPFRRHALRALETEISRAVALLEQSCSAYSSKVSRSAFEPEHKSADLNALAARIADITVSISHEWGENCAADILESEAHSQLLDHRDTKVILKITLMQLASARQACDNIKKEAADIACTVTMLESLLTSSGDEGK